MKKSYKLLLGAATCWPVVYIPLFISVIFSMVFFAPHSHGLPLIFPFIFIFHFLTIAMSIALMVYYVVHLFKNEQIDKDKKLIWAIVLLMGGIIAMPIYWFMYIWRAQSINANPAQQQFVINQTSYNPAYNLPPANYQQSYQPGYQQNYQPNYQPEPRNQSAPSTPQQPPDWR